MQFLCPLSCSLSLTSVQFLCPKSCSWSFVVVQFLCALLQGFGFEMARKSAKTYQKHCFLPFSIAQAPSPQPPRQFQERCLAPGTCGQSGRQTHNQMQMILIGSAMRTACQCLVVFFSRLGTLNISLTVLKLTGPAKPHLNLTWFLPLSRPNVNCFCRWNVCAQNHAHSFLN